MCCESNLLSVSAITCDQILVNRAEPVVSYNGLSCSGELIGSEPQEPSESVNMGWGWWWRVVVVVLHELGHHLHQLSLGCQQLLDCFLGWITSRRHLGVYEIDENKTDRTSRSNNPTHAQTSAYHKHSKTDRKSVV